MIISIDTGKPQTKLPYSADFNKWKRNLADVHYDEIVDTLNAKFDTGEVHTAGWIPGHNWMGRLLRV